MSGCRESSMTTPTPSTPLLPCPFCGDKFEIDKSDPHLFKIRLGDAHGNCPIDENIEFSSEAQLIEYMNKRAAPATPAPSLPLAELDYGALLARLDYLTKCFNDSDRIKAIPEAASAIRAQAERVRALTEAHDRLYKFWEFMAEKLVESPFWEGEDEWEISEHALELGLPGVSRVKYDPEIHGENDCEPGSEIIWMDVPALARIQSIVGGDGEKAGGKS